MRVVQEESVRRGKKRNICRMERVKKKYKRLRERKEGMEVCWGGKRKEA